MADQILKDNRGRIIGKIRQVGNKLELRDAKGRLKGRYDIKKNETRNAKGRLVGKGNLLAMLLEP